jgi:hypothetical protein
VYQAKLRADLLAPPAGAFSAITKMRLQCLLGGWERQLSASELAACVVQTELRGDSLWQRRVAPGRFA